MTTLEELKAKRQEVLNTNKNLYETGNRSDFLTKRVNELLCEEWQLRYKCAEEGINHNIVE